MWPWGHLGFGYVLYTVYQHVVHRETPTDWPVVAMALGTQFPDMVDKPLAWWVGILPNGRSLTHSLITATILIAAVHMLARRFDQSHLATAFGIGYLSHLVGDSFGPILSGSPDKLAFLLWPVLPPIVYNDGKLVSHLTSIEFTPLFFAQIAVVFGMVLLWISDGVPGTFGLLRQVRKNGR